MDDSSSTKEQAVSNGGIPPQLTRLALTFLALIGAFFIFRSQTVPATFGKDGFYRGAVVSEIAALPVMHAGASACADCHSDKVEGTAHSKAGVSCESCHGPAFAHTEDPGAVKPVKPAGRDFCGRCHGKVPARPAGFPQVDLKIHNPDNNCIDCHAIHESTEAAHE